MAIVRKKIEFKCQAAAVIFQLDLDDLVRRLGLQDVQDAVQRQDLAAQDMCHLYIALMV